MASDSIVDERTLREIYLTGFEMVVKEAQPKTIMSAYNLVNGTYANENAHLLQDILRKDWGFDGAVVTDWGGSNDHALGVKNGSTLEMPAPGGDAVRELLAAEGLLIKNHVDCGCILYDAAEQTVKSGGSGPGCCASVLCGHILPRLEKGTQKRVLFIATGALMSQTTFLQKESIPAIAHLVELRSPQQKEENG